MPVSKVLSSFKIINSDKYFYILKNIKERFKKINWLKLVALIDDVIEHRLFKPVVISILTIFVLFQGFSLIQNLILDYQDHSFKRLKNTPVKVNISADNLRLNIEEEQVVDYVVKSGDTLLKIFVDIGAGETDIFNILNEMKKIYSPRAIVAGDHIIIKYKLKIDYEPVANAVGNIKRKAIITSAIFSPSVEKEIIVSRKRNDEYEVEEVEIELVRHISKFAGDIKNSLFIDGVDAGVSPTTMMNMINLYSYDVDFQRDIRKGDKFEILVESFYRENGKKVKDGNILFSALTLRNSTIEAYFYEMKNGLIEYFDAKGRSVRKSLLRTPVNGARISSGFGFRKHPVLGYSKLHKGVDFAAPRGTPIFAAGSGTISYYGRYGSYGNFVKIRHNAEYSTAYAHASKFVRKLHVGSRVKQGDVIAYVGTTGRSTGPHLHYEVLRRGKAINPSKVKATSGLKLSGKKLKDFLAKKAEIEQYRKTIPNQIHN